MPEHYPPPDGANSPPAPSRSPIDPLLRGRADAPRWSADDVEGVALPAARRRRPAFASKLASLMLSIAATLGLAALFARADGQQTIAGSADDPDAGEAGDTVVAMPPATTGSTASPSSSPPPSTTQVGGIAIEDGIYAGDAFTNRWGVVQVEITYQGGLIVDVGVLRYPDGDRKSVSINQRALPLLEDAVLTAQGAGISSITGATITSRSYQLSLQSAIDAAAAASAAGEG